MLLHCPRNWSGLETRLAVCRTRFTVGLSNFITTLLWSRRAKNSEYFAPCNGKIVLNNSAQNQTALTSADSQHRRRVKHIRQLIAYLSSLFVPEAEPLGKSVLARKVAS
jgi:hypothetical protein